MSIYDAADRAIREMNRANLKAFNRLKLAKWDEMSVIRAVSDVYATSTALAKRKYTDIGLEAFVSALEEVGLERQMAKGMAEDEITADWTLDMLEEADPVTLYLFLDEAERKKQRLIEALAVAQNKGAEIDKALRYWTRQTAQYTINATDRARIGAFKAVGVKRVMWNTERDDRVCHDCAPLDGEVFDIDAVPPKPHLNCRCWITAVKD